MTALWSKIQQEPTAFGEMLRVWLFVAMGFGVLQLTDSQQSQLLMAVSVTIAFFTRRATTPNVKVEAKAERRADEKVQERATASGRPL